MNRLLLSAFAILVSVSIHSAAAQSGETAAAQSWENAAAQSAADEAIASKIDSCAARLRSDWKIPGFSLTVCRGGRTILSNGYGVKVKGGTEAVDGSTVYQIGSVSKSFTAALMAMMVDEGLVKWDDRVVDILPDFDLYDKGFRDEVRVSDLMTHKMGFYSQAMTYVPNVGYDADDLMRIIARVKPEYPLRDGMHYNNMTFIIAQKIIEKVSRLSWEENLQKRIFGPLGMTTASCGGEGFLKAENVAMQHDMYRAKGAINTSPIRGEGRALHWLTVVGPAGGINCSSEDLARWSAFHLKGVTPSGDSLISATQLEYIHSGVAVSAQTDEKITLYGHCWYIEQNRTCRIWYHTGTTWGHAALCVWVPELDLNFAMLFNSEVPSAPRFALMRCIIDICRGVECPDYSGEALAQWMNHSGGSSHKNPFTYKYSSAQIPPQALCGHYTKEEPFGDAEISLSNGKLYITIGKYGWKHRLQHTKGNMYFFHSDGHRFPVRIKAGGDKAAGFELDWGCGESLGPWTRK